MAHLRKDYIGQMDSILAAAERQDKRELKRLLQSFAQMLEDSSREQVNVVGQLGTLKAALKDLTTKVGPLAGSPAAGLQSASKVASGIRTTGANTQTGTPDDSGSYGLWEAVLATGEVAKPGMAMTLAGRVAYIATATDAGRPMTHVYVTGTQNGTILCRSGGQAQCLRLLPGVTNGPMYLSTTPGFLTDDPTETTGGTRAIFQPVGQLEKDISTMIGATGLCIVGLNIQAAQNVTP